MSLERIVNFITLRSQAASPDLIIFFFFFSVKDRIRLKILKLCQLFNFPWKFSFFGGMLQKKSLVLYKFQCLHFHHLSKIILLSILERIVVIKLHRSWPPVLKILFGMDLGQLHLPS